MDYDRFRRNGTSHGDCGRQGEHRTMLGQVATEAGLTLLGFRTNDALELFYVSNGAATI